MREIDLGKLTKNEVAVLLGYDYGATVREHYELDQLDALDESVVIRLPTELETIAPSFVQGMFGKSVLGFGTKARFFEHYQFLGWPHDMLQQIDTGLTRALMNRSNISETVSH